LALAAWRLVLGAWGLGLVAFILFFWPSYIEYCY